MQKIPSLFLRDFKGDPQFVTTVPNPLCMWVFNGEGVATRKRDGWAMKISGVHAFKRYDAKVRMATILDEDCERRVGKDRNFWLIRPAPPDFTPAQEPDGETGHWPGWVQCDSVKDPLVWRAIQHTVAVISGHLEDGTYEICGPRIGTRAGNNPEGLDESYCFRHGGEPVNLNQPGTFDRVKEFLTMNRMEGIVWHHPDGRFAKIKARDFGIKWPRT